MSFRKKKITGYISDSSGNVIPNASITIKRVVESGSINYGNIKAGVSGFFESDYLPAGKYEVYESGVFSQGVDHSVGSIIPSYMSSIDRSEDNEDPNTNFAFIKIESRGVKFFPTTSIVSSEIRSFFSSVNAADIETTYGRFDVEFYDEVNGKYIKWAGVPGIRFDGGDVHIPIDYMSMVFARPYRSSQSTYVISAKDVSTKKRDITVRLPEKPKSGDIIEVCKSTGKFYQFIFTGIRRRVTADLYAYECYDYLGVKNGTDNSNSDPTGSSTSSSNVINVYPGIDVTGDDFVAANSFTVTESPITGVKVELYKYPA